MNNTVKIGLIQSICSDDKDINLQVATANIKKAASKGAQIVCLQELFSTKYFCEIEDHRNFELAETIPQQPIF